MPLQDRPLRGEEDLPEMHAMLAAARRVAAPGEGGWHVGDLTWRYHMLWYRADPRAQYRLWLEAGRIVGFAVVGEDGSYDWQLHPDHAWRGIEDQMLAWAESRWRAAVDEGLFADEPDRRLPTGSLETDRRRIAFLEGRGYKRGDQPMVHYVRDLRAPVAAPALPAGFVVRGVTGAHEAPSRAEAHRQAFHPSRVTDEGYLALMRMPGYDQELDVVVATEDGIVAAYAMCWVDEANRIGLLEPVGVRPAYRRMGLARAAVLEGLRRMRDREADSAIVCTDEGNVAEALYASVGFAPTNRDWDYWRGPARR